MKQTNKPPLHFTSQTRKQINTPQANKQANKQATDSQQKLTLAKLKNNTKALVGFPYNKHVCFLACLLACLLARLFVCLFVCLTCNMFYVS